MPERRPLDAGEIDRLMDGSSLGTPDARRTRSVADASVVNRALGAFLDNWVPSAPEQRLVRPGPRVPDGTTSSEAVARSAVAFAAHRLVRDELEAERARLRAQISALSVSGRPYDENFADSGQVAAESGENQALVAQLREQLVEIERALRKIDDGTYGA